MALGAEVIDLRAETLIVQSSASITGGTQVTLLAEAADGPLVDSLANLAPRHAAITLAGTIQVGGNFQNKWNLL